VHAVFDPDVYLWQEGAYVDGAQEFDGEVLDGDGDVGMGMGAFL